MRNRIAGSTTRLAFPSPRPRLSGILSAIREAPIHASYHETSSPPPGPPTDLPKCRLYIVIAGPDPAIQRTCGLQGPPLDARVKPGHDDKRCRVRQEPRPDGCRTRPAMTVSTTDILPPNPVGVARAAALLRSGALVAFGTETVYGLGADATDPRAVAAVFEAKGRPRFNPLICHYPDAAAAFAQVAANPIARRARGGVLAGAADLGAAARGRVRGGAADGGRAGYAGGTGAGPSGGAGAARRRRAAGRRALGQPLGSGQSDHGTACAGRAGRAGRRDPRLRALSGRRGIDGARPERGRPSCCAPAG